MATTPIVPQQVDPVAPPQAVPATPAPTAPAGDWFMPPEPEPEPQASEWFLDAGTSKYRTEEEARRGYAEKDSFIAQQKQHIAALQQALQTVNAGTPPTQQPGQSSFSDPWVDALDQTVKGKPKMFQETVRKDIRADVQEIVNEQLKEIIGPIAPILQHANLNRAVEVASTAPWGDPNIANFVRSEAFAKTLSQPGMEPLREAISAGRNNFTYSENLPHLLVYTYRLAQAVAPAPAQPRTTPPATTPPGPTPVATSDATARREQLYSLDWKDVFGTGDRNY